MAIRSNKHSKSIAGILPEKKKMKETLLDSRPNRKCTFFFMSKKIVQRSRKEKIGIAQNNIQKSCNLTARSTRLSYITL